MRTVGEMVNGRIRAQARQGGTGGIRDAEDVIYHMLVALPQVPHNRTTRTKGG